MTLIDEQRDICRKYGEEVLFPLPNENGTCGWYIWYGEELSEDSDFFKPLHVEHIEEYLSMIQKYFSLPIGYRLFFTENYK